MIDIVTLLLIIATSFILSKCLTQIKQLATRTAYAITDMQKAIDDCHSRIENLERIVE